MNLTRALALALTCVFGAACSASEGEPAAASEASDVTAAQITGEYEPSTPADGSDFFFVSIREEGGKTILDLDGFEFDLLPTASGARVFSKEDVTSDCDNPGCWNMTKANGVVFLDKDDANRATIKVTIRRDFPFPESEDEPSGEVVDNYRYVKKAR